MATDPSGRPVFADPNYNLVFRVNTDATIQILAGNNVQGLAAGASGGSGGGWNRRPPCAPRFAKPSFIVLFMLRRMGFRA